MNTSHQATMQKIKPRVPLFASPWLALFFVLRDELTQPRTSGK
jgi:hypothetical protein